MKIEKMFDEYLKYSKIYKIEPTYLYEANLVTSLKRCFDFIKVTDTRQLKQEKVDSIISYYQTETACKAISINHHVGLFKRIMKHFKLKNEYLYDMKKLKVTKRHYPTFNEQELIKIFNYINKLDFSRNSYTYKTIIFMLLDTGCRINELLNIKIKNIDFEDRNILLEVTKNKKERFVLFTKLSAPKVQQLMKFNTRKSEYLFYNHLRSRPMNYNDVKLFLRRMQETLGLDKLHAHMFRRTFATKLHENGASLATIQVLLGHETLEMTRNYIDVSFNKVKRDYDNFIHATA